MLRTGANHLSRSGGECRYWYTGRGRAPSSCTRMQCSASLKLDPAALSAGIEKHTLEGLPVRIYSPAKTVADCFKFRNKIGLDVALEALRAFRQDRRGTMDELERMAKICRVSRIIRPYMEALAS